MARKKMTKKIEGNVVSIEVLDGTQGQMDFSVDDLPEDIQNRLAPFGLSHKLGDSAAGKTDVGAEEAIQKTWEALLRGEWAMARIAGPRVSTKAITDNFTNLSEEEQEKARSVLASLGIKIPGLTTEEEEE